MNQRVVVTGLGVVTSHGSALGPFVGQLLEGCCHAGPVSLFDASGFDTRIAAEVGDARIGAGLRDRKSAFAAWAVQAALEHAQSQGGPLPADRRRAGLCCGIGLDLFSMADMVQWLRDEAAGARPADTADGFLQTQADAAMHRLSTDLRLGLPPLLHVSACAASTDAIGQAMRLVRDGEADWMVAGGADSMINPMGFAGFCKIQAMTTRNDAPRAASRPFDRRRDGFLLGEGAAMLVIESLPHAQARGAQVHAELLGWGNSFDAYGISEPHPAGAGALLAMRRALADARLGADAVVHVNAHGTSTPKNDPAEAAALQALLGPRAETAVSVNATKSMLGHLVSASGAAEVAAQIACARAGWLHPTINLDDVDPACRLAHVRGAPLRWQPGGVMLKNSFAFGGQNACLVMRVP